MKPTNERHNIFLDNLDDFEALKFEKFMNLRILVLKYLKLTLTTPKISQIESIQMICYKKLISKNSLQSYFAIYNKKNSQLKLEKINILN